MLSEDGVSELISTIARTEALENPARRLCRLTVGRDSVRIVILLDFIAAILKENESGRFPPAF